MSFTRDDPAAATIPYEAQLGGIEPEVREIVEAGLRVARERLGMEIAWLAEFTDERKVLRVVEGDREDWGLWDDSWLPAAQSYCRRMLDGQIPNAIDDTAAEPTVATLPITRELRIGAYIGVPLVLPGGALRVALCCAQHAPHDGLTDRDVRFLQVLARLIADGLAFRESQEELRRLQRQAASVKALLGALDARDAYTGAHSQAVVDVALAVGRRLGLDEPQLLELEQVALLHDIGKVGIPDTLLTKPGPLTDDEWAVMHRHPAIGAEIVAHHEDLWHLAPALRAEHEHWDGGGYPAGLKEEEIPLTSRIVLVCDGFDAMISDRAYRPAMAFEDALAELRRCSGTMFWPAAVEALLAEHGAQA